MVSFSISYWDLIKFPYFADTTERGDRRWKQAQSQGDVTTHTIVREKKFQAFSIMKEKSYNSRICHPFPKPKNPNLYTWEEGPVWASLWIDCSVCSWCLGKRPNSSFLGAWELELSPSFPTPWNTEQPLKTGPFSYRLERISCNEQVYICMSLEEEVQARSPMLNQKCMKLLSSKESKPNGSICFAQPPNSCWIVSSLTWSLN